MTAYLSVAEDISLCRSQVRTHLQLNIIGLVCQQAQVIGLTIVGRYVILVKNNIISILVSDLNEIYGVKDAV